MEEMKFKSLQRGDLVFTLGRFSLYSRKRQKINVPNL